MVILCKYFSRSRKAVSKRNSLLLKFEAQPVLRRPSRQDILPRRRFASTTFGTKSERRVRSVRQVWVSRTLSQSEHRSKLRLQS